MSDKPIRVQLSRRKGWRMPPNTVSVARPTMWGNPFDAREYGIELALRLFEETARGCWCPSHVQDLDDPTAEKIYALHCAWLKRLPRGHPAEVIRSFLRGRNLACWCTQSRSGGCHADILLRIANEP